MLSDLPSLIAAAGKAAALIKEAHVTVRHQVEVEEEDDTEGNDEEEEGILEYGPTGRQLALR